MSSAEGDHPPIRLDVPAELRAGVYSNIILLGYTATEFTLDFAVDVGPDAGSAAVEEGYVDARLVARVHVPPVLAFDVLRAINGILTRYESEWGEIARPERRKGSGEQD